MPDRYHFDHLVDRGQISHRCIEPDCGWPGYGVTVSEKQRARHRAQHERDRQKEIERARRAGLAAARQMQRLAARENRMLG